LKKKETLKVALRKKVGKEIIKFTSGIYFKDIPLKGLFNILKKHGLVPLQEDDTEWSGMLSGDAETVIFPLASKDSEYTDNGATRYIPFTNAALYLQWYKMQSGKYEITTYVS
jgi:hypothetical protein